jgi:hypothetical protein
VAKVGTSKAGGTIHQQAAVHPWLAADAHVNKQNHYFHGIARNGQICRAKRTIYSFFTSTSSLHLREANQGFKKKDKNTGIVVGNQTRPKKSFTSSEFDRNRQ